MLHVRETKTANIIREKRKCESERERGRYNAIYQMHIVCFSGNKAGRKIEEKKKIEMDVQEKKWEIERNV